MGQHTCSSKVNDAASFREFDRGSPSKAAFLVAGLSGGDKSEAGVVLVSPLEKTSDSSTSLSKMGSFLWLFGDIDMIANTGVILKQ